MIRLIKLITGEDLVASIDASNTADDSLTLYDPLVCKTVYDGGSSFFVMSSWIPLEPGFETSTKVRKEHVVTVALPGDFVEESYLKSLDEMKLDEENNIAYNNENLTVH